MTEKREIKIRLTALEWMVVQLALGERPPPRFLARAGAPFDEQQARGALLEARESLLARNWARKKSEGGIDINPVLEIAHRSVSAPRSSFSLTLIWPGHQPDARFYNTVEALCFANRIDDGVHEFELLDSPQAIADAIVLAWKQCGGGKTANESVRRAYVVGGDAMPAPNADTQSPPDIAASLQRDGVDLHDARQIANLYLKPSVRAALVHVDGRTEALSVRAMAWFADVSSLWMVSERNDGKVAVERASWDELSVAIAEFVRSCLGDLMNAPAS